MRLSEGFAAGTLSHTVVLSREPGYHVKDSVGRTRLRAKTRLF